MCFLLIEFLTCVQINLNKSKVATNELSLSKFKDIALLHEPYVNQSRVRMLDGRRGVILADKSNPRAAIYVRKELEPWLVEEFTDRDLCVCTIKIDGRLWYLASVYLDINFNIKENSNLEKLIDFCNVSKIPLLLGVDSNAHSILWGSESTNGRGEDLEDIILEKDLSVVNVGSVPTFQTIIAKSVIDISRLICQQKGFIRSRTGRWTRRRTPTRTINTSTSPWARARKR